MDLVVSSDVESDVTVLTVSGDVDAFSAPQLRDGIEAQIAAGRHTLVVDLDAVPFMDSTGLGVLVGGLRLATLHQGAMTLGRIPARIQRVMLITGLDDVFDIAATRAAAIDAARAKAAAFS